MSGGKLGRGRIPRVNHSGVINDFTDVINPILGVFFAAGMLKGFTNLFAMLGIVGESSGTHVLLGIIGDALFYFLPIFLGYTAMKKFGGTPFIGMMVGAIFVYPLLEELISGEVLYVLFEGTVFEAAVHFTFLGLPVMLNNYGNSIIPTLLAVFLASRLEKQLSLLIDSTMNIFLTPFLIVLVISLLMFLIIGPIIMWLGQVLMAVILALHALSPILTGILLGGAWQVFVVFGIHWTLFPIAVEEMAGGAYNQMLVVAFVASFTQIGTIIAFWTKARISRYRPLSVPAILAGFFGVTELAIYGISLPLKRPLLMSCLAAAVGGGLASLLQITSYQVCGLGIVGLGNYLHPPEGIGRSFWGAVGVMLVSLILGFALTYIFTPEDQMK